MFQQRHNFHLGINLRQNIGLRRESVEIFKNILLELENDFIGLKDGKLKMEN